MIAHQCQTCRHWGAGIRLGDDPLLWGTDVDQSGHRVCALTITNGPFINGPEATDTTSMLAYAEDYDGDPRGVWTLPDFGCVQWEAQE